MTADLAPQPASARRSDLLAPAASLVTVVLWASAFVGIRHVGHTLSPGALTLGRLLVAGAALGTLSQQMTAPARAGEPLAALATLLADTTRATMCLALLDGRAWTAGELARLAPPGMASRLRGSCAA